MKRLDALAAFVRYVMRDTTYADTFAATVEMDRGATVDVLPDDARIRGTGLQFVPKGDAGAETTVAPGSRCLIAFRDSDPSKPYVCAWEYEQRKAVVRLIDGNAKIARLGDPIRMLVSNPAVVSGTIGGSYVVPGTPPTVVPVPPGTPFRGAVAGILPETIAAKIIGGKATVLA